MTTTRHPLSTKDAAAIGKIKQGMSAQKGNTWVPRPDTV
jgi:hypothetical protein